MQKAQKRDACRKEKFWFRKEITTHISPPEANECCRKGGAVNCQPSNCDVYACMTVDEIINGKVGMLLLVMCRNSCFFLTGGRISWTNTID